MTSPSPLSRRQWLISSGAALAGLTLSSRFLNDEMRAQAATPHLPGASPIKARLSLNENPLGPSPAALEAMLQNLTAGKAPRYPFGELGELLALIAKKEGVTPDHIVLGVGSGEILETVGLHFGLLKGEVIHGAPGYVQLVGSAVAAGGKAVPVPLNARLEHDLPAMNARINERTSLVYIANPHNPTGTALDPAALKAFVTEASLRTFVFIDEAYLDIADRYSERTVVGLVNDTRNLLVARTFSKVYGLAGLRIGYGVTNPKFAARLRTYGLGTLTGPGIAGATASLKDTGYVAATRAKIVAERDRLLALLRELGRTYAEPQSNFVFFHAGRPHKAVFDGMMAQGVAIARPFSPLLDWARISIGLPEENALARAALRKVLG